MVCVICGNFGIYWKNLSSLSAYTYCPHCKNTNCQKPEVEYEEEEE
jgi:hypothetical protein